MNDHQRKMRRKKGYAGGGIVSTGIEKVGRFFGTEKAKKIDEANEFLKPTKSQQAVESQRTPTKSIGVRRAADIEAAEQKALGYRHGGKVRRPSY